VVGVENWLPAFDVGERHETKIALPPERALQRALATAAAPDAFIRFLFRLRGLSPDGSIERFMETNGFVVLERTARTYVVGLVARRARLVPVRDSVGWREIDRPYSLKIAADFRAEPAPEGARVITETRVAATSFWALVVFRLYWLVVGPFSALIRRRWLRAAARQTAGV
jgi:hypothetical protein